MADTQTTVTETGTDSGNTGSGAPNDAPARSSVRTYSQEEFDTHSAKTRRAVSAETQAKADRAWLERLGVTSLDEAEQLLTQVKSVKPKQTDAEASLARAKADYESRIQAAEQARQQAEQQRNQEMLKAFLLQHVADTNDPRLAMSLFGMSYVPEKRLGIGANGRPVVIDADGTELPHLDPEKYVRDTLSAEALAFLRKPTGTSAGTRIAHSATSPAPKKPAPRNESERFSAIREMVEQSFNAAAKSNGSR